MEKGRGENQQQRGLDETVCTRVTQHLRLGLPGATEELEWARSFTLGQRGLFVRVNQGNGGTEWIASATPSADLYQELLKGCTLLLFS